MLFARPLSLQCAQALRHHVAPVPVDIIGVGVQSVESVVLERLPVERREEVAFHIRTRVSLHLYIDIAAYCLTLLVPLYSYPSYLRPCSVQHLLGRGSVLRLL